MFAKGNPPVVVRLVHVGVDLHHFLELGTRIFVQTVRLRTRLFTGMFEKGNPPVVVSLVHVRFDLHRFLVLGIRIFV